MPKIQSGTFYHFLLRQAIGEQTEILTTHAEALKTGEGIQELESTAPSRDVLVRPGCSNNKKPPLLQLCAAAHH